MTSRVPRRFVPGLRPGEAHGKSRTVPSGVRLSRAAGVISQVKEEYEDLQKRLTLSERFATRQLDDSVGRCPACGRADYPDDKVRTRSLPSASTRRQAPAQRDSASSGIAVP